MFKNNKAFTLIELMIAVAIVGILSAIALPAYQDYTIRGQVSEGLGLVSGPKVFVVDYYTNKGVLPQQSSDIPLPPTSGSYVSSIELVGGVLEITFSSTAPKKANQKIDRKKVMYTPGESSLNNLIWTCSSDMDKKYLPSSCL